MAQDEERPPLCSPEPATRGDARAAARAPLASLRPLRALGEGSFSLVDLVLLPSPRSGGCAVSGGRAAALKQIKVRRRASPTTAPDGDDGGEEGAAAAAAAAAAASPEPPTPRTAAAMLRSEREAHERAGGCAFVAHAFALKQGRPPPQSPRPLSSPRAAAAAAASAPTTTTTTAAAPPPPPNLALLLEYHPGGDLAQLLARRRADPLAAAKPWLDEPEARFVAACALLALESLHGGRCIHRDVKPGNLFVSRAGYAVLGDLGCAAVLPRAPCVAAAADAADKDADAVAAAAAPPAAAAVPPAWCIYRGRHCSAVSGTRGYMAPEVEGAAGAGAPSSPGAAKSYGAAADLFSLGVVLFELASGERPLTAAAAAAVAGTAGGGTSGRTAAAAAGAAGGEAARASPGTAGLSILSLEEEPPSHLPYPSHFSPGLCALLTALLSRDPTLRPTAAEAQRAPWFASFDWAALRSRTMAPPAVLLAAAAEH